MSTKSEIIEFLRAFRIEFENRIDTKYTSCSEFAALQSAVENIDSNSENTVDTSNFVEKEAGKGLSTNDFTDADKVLLNNLAENSSDSVDFNSSDLDYIFQ